MDMSGRDNVSTGNPEIDLVELLKSPKRRRFVVLYVENGGNGTAAAESAGFAMPAQEAVRLLKDVNVKKAVERYARIVCSNVGETRDTVINRERIWASHDIGRVFIDTPESRAEFAAQGIKHPSQLDEDTRRCIKKISFSQHGIASIEFYDAGRANRALAEYLGMTKQEDQALGAEDAANLIAAAMGRMDELDGDS
jgi:hypothetical protein